MAEALAVRALTFMMIDFSKTPSSELYQLRKETNDMIEQHGQKLVSLIQSYLEEGILEINEVLAERCSALTMLREAIPDVKKMMKETFPIGDSYRVGRIKAYVPEIGLLIGRLRLVDTNKDEIDDMRRVEHEVRTNLSGLMAEKLARFIRKARERPLVDLEYTILSTMAYELGSICSASRHMGWYEDDLVEARDILREIYKAQTIKKSRRSEDLNKHCENKSHWACDGCDDCSTQHWKIV